VQTFSLTYDSFLHQFSRRSRRPEGGPGVKRERNPGFYANEPKPTKWATEPWSTGASAARFTGWGG
jgi:hypothetical protein